MSSIIRRAGAKLLKLLERAADPGATANQVGVYVKDVAGVGQLFAQTDDGTVHQMTPATGGPFLPVGVLSTPVLPIGLTNDWIPAGAGPVWPTGVRTLVVGDPSGGSIITGVDSTGIAVGKVFVFEVTNSGDGPITIVDWQDPVALASLAQNRIVLPGPLAAGVEIPEGGIFALMKIEDASILHGWRLLWSATNTFLALQAQHMQLVHPLAIVLPAGDTNALATAGILKSSRLQITTNAAGSSLSGIVHAALLASHYGEGAVKVIENLGPGMLTIGHLRGAAFDVSFYTPNAIDVVLGIGSSATVMYDAVLGCWAWISSSQSRNLGLGAEIAPAALPIGDTNDWNPAGIHETSRVLVTCNALGSTLTGINAGQDGEVKYLFAAYAGGAGPLTLAEYRTSAGANRFVLPGLVDYIVQPGGAVAIIYKVLDGAWVVLA